MTKVQDFKVGLSNVLGIPLKKNINNKKRAKLQNNLLVKWPEQKAMTVDNAGYEEAFEDVNRPNVESASERPM